MLVLCSMLSGTYYTWLCWHNRWVSLDNQWKCTDMSAPVQFYSKVQYAYIACYNWIVLGVVYPSAIFRDVTFLAVIYFSTRIVTVLLEWVPRTALLAFSTHRYNKHNKIYHMLFILYSIPCRPLACHGHGHAGPFSLIRFLHWQLGAASPQ